MTKNKEEKGGKSDLPKLEGLKWPDGKSFVSGLTANHLQWIYEPASLIMMTISFYSYKYFFDQRERWGLDERWAFSLGMLGTRANFVLDRRLILFGSRYIYRR